MFRPSAARQVITGLLMLPLIIGTFVWGRLELLEERARSGAPTAGPPPGTGPEFHWSWGLSLAGLIVFVAMFLWVARRRRARACGACGASF
jgi:hypothetical protein